MLPTPLRRKCLAWYPAARRLRIIPELQRVLREGGDRPRPMPDLADEELEPTRPRERRADRLRRALKEYKDTWVAQASAPAKAGCR